MAFYVELFINLFQSQGKTCSIMKDQVNELITKELHCTNKLLGACTRNTKLNSIEKYVLAVKVKLMVILLRNPCYHNTWTITYKQNRRPVGREISTLVFCARRHRLKSRQYNERRSSEQILLKAVCPTFRGSLAHYGY